MNKQDILVVWNENATDEDKKKYIKIKEVIVEKDYPDIKYIGIIFKRDILKRYHLNTTANISELGSPYIKIFHRHNYRHVCDILFKGGMFKGWEFFNTCIENTNMITFVAMRDVYSETLIEMLNDKIKEER